MHKNIAMALAAIFFLSLSACSPLQERSVSSEGVSQGALVDDREIVALVSGDVARNRMQRVAATKGYTLRQATPLDELGLIMLSFEMPEGTTGPEAIVELEAAVPGSTVGVNHAFRTHAVTTQNATGSYANDMLNWPDVGCRAMMRIGMIDTHVNARAAGLLNRQVIQNDFTAGGARAERHGTEIASVLADPTRLRDATVFSAAVIGETEDAVRAAGADTLIKALDWLIAQDVKVANMSLAGPYNKLLDLAVERAGDRGLIIVAAVGNGGPEGAALYPAAFASVIAVTAVDADGRIYRRAIRGQHVDLSAPGVDILARSAQGTRFVTGTSVAAPFVTARIAADATVSANAGVDAVRQSLFADSRDLGPAGRDRTYGSGLMQAIDICSG